jgi:hypothetical protein
MNLSLWVLFPPFCTGSLGNSREPKNFAEWSGNCASCGKRIQPMQGIFCASFSFSRGPFPPCGKTWCANGYVPKTLVSFYTYEPEDDDGFVWLKKRDEKRFHTARNGDNLLTHFQCDLCVFRNVHKRDPTRLTGDELAMCCYRSANLAALWSREPGTVSSNLRLIKRAVDYGSALNHRSPFPDLGPMPLEEITGHGVAATVLLASKEPGKYHVDHSQYELVPKYRSAFSSVWQAGCSGAGFSVSTGRNKSGQSVLLTLCPTESEWYKRVDTGLKKRTGQDIRSQLGFSIEVMLVMLERMESRYTTLTEGDDRDDVLGAMTYACISYCNALRGNEGFKCDLGGLATTCQKRSQPS